ncbi:hypothetical protein ACEZDB_06215 [Streptacidiphilus sp. N1-3]|uniref:Excalibur calcium-binding domain-containing protein n=1 Tax=Streptacidiphilus alkalitolerans TaxID=3342712 RepID=A0ABV6WWC4_9ACTN
MTTASAQAHPCPAYTGQRVLLGTPVNIWDRELDGISHTDTSIGVLYLGYLPQCRQVYAEIHLNASGNMIKTGTIYLNDERNNSEGRVSFGPASSNAYIDSGFVSIDVPEYNAGSTYAAPKAFQAALDYTEYWPCNTIVTSGTHQFSGGKDFNNGNGATCDHP